MKIFRWGGLAGFVIVTALLVVIGFVFLDGWMKKAIEAAGMKLNGAEVNVADVDLTLNPLGFKVEGMQVADADKPTHNAIEFGVVNFDVNFPQLFLGNIRINDLTIADVQTNTERRTPAKLAEKKPEAEGESKAAQAVKAKADAIGAQLPEPKNVIDENSANTQQAVADAKTSLENSKQQVNDSVAQLPDDEQLASYKQRIAEIKAIELDSLDNIKKSQALIKSVGKDLASDKLAIEKTKFSINQALKDSKNSVADIADAPAEDWAQLQENYPLNKESALKVAQLLLGESFFSKVEQAQYWYEKAKPWLARLKSDEDEAPEIERAQGEFVSFPHPDPTAKFQLDSALLSLVADNWPWQLQVEDVTSHTGALFKPVKLNLRRGDAGNEALLINGLLDQIDGQSKDTFVLQGKGVEFAAQSLNLAGTQLNWQPEAANVSGEIIALAGNLDGLVRIDFPVNQFSAQGQGSSARLVADAVKQVTQFKIDIIVSGTTKKPKISVNSDLDRQLSGAFAGVAEAEYQAWLAKVKAQLDAKVQELRAPIDEAYAKLEAEKQAIEQRIEQFEAEVEAEIRSLEDKANAEQKRLEDALKAEVDKAKMQAEAEAEKLRQKLEQEKQQAEAEAEKARLAAEAEAEAARKKAEEEKRQAEEAAKKAAEEKLKEEANKLKLKF